MLRKSRIPRGIWLSWTVLALVVFLLGAGQANSQDSGVDEGTPVLSPPQSTSPVGNNGQAEDNNGNGQLPNIRVRSNLVMTPVTVIDSSGDFVYNLKGRDFEIFDNGIQQHIEGFDSTPQPVALVIVVQTNDDSSPLLQQVRPLGPVFSTLMLGSKGKAAVITFADHVNLVQDFSSDSDRLSKTLKGLETSGSGARLNDAVLRAVTLLEKQPRDDRRIIVAFSDGFDHGSKTGKAQVVREAANGEVTIYGLGFSRTRELLGQKPEATAQSPMDTNVARPLPAGMPQTPTNSDIIYSTPVPVIPIVTATGEIVRSTLLSSLLEYYAGYTGGVYYSHWSGKALQEQLTKVASEINSQYELAYIPNDLGKPGFHRIEVRVLRPAVKVRARAGYFYTGKTQKGASLK